MTGHIYRGQDGWYFSGAGKRNEGPYSNSTDAQRAFEAAFVAANPTAKSDPRYIPRTIDYGGGMRSSASRK